MFDFNTAKEDIGNTQLLNDILNRAIWDNMLMSEKLKYLMGISNLSAIMKHKRSDLLKFDSPNKIVISINIYKSTYEKQYDILSTMYYKIFYFGKKRVILDNGEDDKIITFTLFDAVTIRYTYSISPDDSDLRTTSYEIIKTDYEKLKINLFDTQTFLKN